MTRIHHPASRADRLKIKKKLLEKKLLSKEERLTKLGKKLYKEHVKDAETKHELVEGINS